MKRGFLLFDSFYRRIFLGCYNEDMLSLEEMLIRLFVAVALGALIGFERDLAGKEAGVRTDIMVGAGAAIFAMIGLSLPYIVAFSTGHMEEILAHNAGFFSVIANVVIGVGFLGAGVIIKQGSHVLGLTTAGTVWFVAAIGVLCGIGLLKFAVIAAVALTLVLFLLRKVDFYRMLGK